mgnify:FL=1|tara:strand:+ start:216 stop:947 length:732 start_codon:yes stop_codon:yes gene_type:complete
MQKPKLYVAMPCYDSVRVETMISLLDTFSALGKSGIEAKFQTVKSSLVTHARNLLTCGFLQSDCDHMLCVDADVQFSPEAIMRMLVPKEFIVCTPYRVKEDPLKTKYTVRFKNPDLIKILPWDMVEIEEGPAGLMLINRIVFERLMDKHPELKIEFKDPVKEKMNKEIGAIDDAIGRYMYNFWDTTFSLKTGEWKGEDLSFCQRAREAGFKIYANLDSTTVHHGNWGWQGKFGDTLKTNKEVK